MLSASTQFEFAAEFVGLLVAAAGLVLVVLRTDVAARSRVARPVLAVGFVLLGGAAFAHGSQILERGAGPLLGGARGIGGLALVAGARSWSGGRRTRAALVVGALVVGAGGLAEAAAAAPITVAAVLAAGSLVIGVALLGAARRSIAVRVAANAAATLLLVVLVLSVALSSVITSSVEHEQRAQFATRATIEAGDLSVTADGALEGARLVAANLDALASSHSGAKLDAADAARRLSMIASFYPVGALAYLPRTGGLVGSSPVLGADAAAVAADLSCTAGRSGSAGRRALLVVGSRAAAAAAFPVCAVGPTRQLGTVVVQAPLDDAYLAGLRHLDPAVSLALVDASGVLAEVGPEKAGAVAPVSTPAAVAARLTDGRFVAVVPVPSLATGASAAPEMSIVVSLSAATIAATRASLLRTLFIIALGGTLLALGLAALTGDRITSGLRRLTGVAQDIEGGRVSERVGAVSEDEVGALAGAFDAMVDAIEEKNAALGRAADDETRLRNRLEAVIAGMSDALVAVDTAGAVTACNRAAEALLGVRAEAAIGRQVTAVVVLAEGDGTDAMERIRSLDARPWTALARVTGPDGTAVPVAVSSGAVLGPGAEVVGTVLVLRDLRREHELERMKSEFLARVGHELRTPLTGILGYADILMRRDVSTAQARQWHGEILDAAKRQLRVVQLLEFFASAEAGRVMLRPAPTDVDRLVTDAVDAWAERLPDGFRIMTRLETDLPPVVADRRWTVLALGELIDNAVKFSTGAGQVVVRAARAEGAGGAGVVAISVSDRGPGMSLEEQARAFGDFEQGDASDTRSHGGLGLGLSAVLRIVDGLGGAVECRSAPGRGTTITVHLPVAASEHGNAP